jgi:hypothetical protein
MHFFVAIKEEESSHLNPLSTPPPRPRRLERPSPVVTLSLNIKYAYRAHLHRMGGGLGVRDAARGVRFFKLKENTI